MPEPMPVRGKLTGADIRGGSPSPNPLRSLITKFHEQPLSVQIIEEVMGTSAVVGGILGCSSPELITELLRKLGGDQNASPPPSGETTGGVPTESMPTAIPTESPTYQQLDAIRQKVLELARNKNGVSVIDSTEQSALTDEQKTALKQFQDSQQANIDTILSAFTQNADISILSTQVVSSTTTDGKFEFGFSTLTYTDKVSKQPIGNALNFQFLNSDGKVINAVLIQDQEETINGKTVKRFLAVPEPGQGTAFPALIAIYDNPNDPSPSQVSVLAPDGGNFKVMSLLGNTNSDSIKQLLGKSIDTSKVSFRIESPAIQVKDAKGQVYSIPTDALENFSKIFNLDLQTVETSKDLQVTQNKDVSGNTFLTVVYNFEAPNGQKLEVPLYIGENKNGQLQWSESSPAKLFTLQGKTLEVVINSYRYNPQTKQWDFLLNDGSDYSKLILESGNSVTITGELDTNWVFGQFQKSDWDNILANWDSIKTQLDNHQIPSGFNYKWDGSQQIIDFAVKNGLKIRVQHLATDTDVPEAFNSYSPDQVKKLLEFVVKTRVIKYGDQVTIWDLPDESAGRSIVNQGFWTGNKLSALETNELVAQFVRDIKPNAQLALVDDLVMDNGFPPVPDFADRYFAFVDQLIQAKVPITYLISENNFGVNFDPVNSQKIKYVFDQAKKRGLMFYGGETTVTTSNIFAGWPSRPIVTNVPLADRPFIQGQMYYQLVADYFDNGANSFGLGNSDDTNSWQRKAGNPNDNSALANNENPGDLTPAWYYFMAASYSNLFSRSR
ncbi:hypothetical protein M1328_02300 [Patescibacteria group bacterium]|nr:hypothetical protein [Patescibacteria group bacterium]